MVSFIFIVGYQLLLMTLLFSISVVCYSSTILDYL